MAVAFEDAHLTYADLDARANQLAHHLRTFGVGPDVVVGLCLERSLDMVVGLLGILKAGGAYLPLDPGNPVDRLAFMLSDAKSPVVVTRGDLSDRLPAGSARIVRMDADAPQIAVRPVTAPETGVGSRNLAYVIYTSGSTGKPKGRDERASRGGQPALLDAGRLSAHTVRCRSSEDTVHVRCVGLGVPVAADVRCPARHGQA